MYCNVDDNYEPWGKINMSWPNGNTFGPRFDIIHPKTGKPTKVPDRGWRWSENAFKENLNYDNIIERYDGSYICGNIWFAKDENTQPSSIKYLKDVSQMLLRSIISLKSDGGIEIENLFAGKSFFAYPKPVSLLKLLISSLEETEGIYLDFFSGSATTAHAIFEKNNEDKGTRKFIMVQLPEKLDESSEAYKAGFEDLCEIGKERIRRAAKKIKEEMEAEGKDTSKMDFGFRVLKLDSSNMKDVYYTPQETTLDLFSENNVKEDRTAEDLLFQVMPKCDLMLSEKITKESINGKDVYFVKDNYLAACFDNNLTDDVIKEIAKRQPYHFVMKEGGAMKDSVLDNFEQIFKTYSAGTKCMVI